jgi:lysine-N-methylase
MSIEAALPLRPRLAEHVVLRRHLADGREIIMAHDLRTEQMVDLTARQLKLIRCADGTRDLGGVVLAAVRQGVYRRSTELLELLGTLQEAGMLADGIEAGAPRWEPAPARPLSVLPNYTLHCDHNATCCGTYGAVAFSVPEAARACALVPSALGADPVAPDRFLPVEGSAGGSYAAVTMVDGHCPYLAEDGRCRIQLAAGPESKPLGCQLFPATFVDDGSCVRVSVAVECPCVLASVGVAGGAELVPAAATQAGHLWPTTPVVRLTEPVDVAEGRSASLAQLHAWSAALCEQIPAVDDPLAALWSLASCVRTDGLNVTASLRCLKRPASPPEEELVQPLMALAGRTQAKHESLARWRSAADRTRQLAAWLQTGAAALLDPTQLAERLAKPDQRVAHERFYLIASLFGHHLVSDSLTLEQSLRDRATRLLLARQLPLCVPPSCAEHPSVPYPLAAVESMMRGQGLSAYAHG